MGEAPGPRGEKGLMTPLHRSGVSRATSSPHCEDERLAGPALPFLAQIIVMRIRAVCRQGERCIADHEHRLVRQRRECLEILRLSTRFSKARSDLPDVAAQELEQGNRS